MRAWSPTRTTSTSGAAAMAWTAPATFGAGPWSPPIASSAIRMLLPFGLHLDDFAALVMSAIGAHAMRQHRFVALRAELDLRRLRVMMTAAVTLLRPRRTSLRNGHVSTFLRAKTAWNQGS